jgi:hypothetical protein
MSETLNLNVVVTRSSRAGLQRGHVHGKPWLSFTGRRSRGLLTQPSQVPDALYRLTLDSVYAFMCSISYEDALLLFKPVTFVYTTTTKQRAQTSLINSKLQR